MHFGIGTLGLSPPNLLTDFAYRNGIQVPPPPPRYVEERPEPETFPPGRALSWPDERADAPNRNNRANRPRKQPEARREASRKEEAWNNKPAKPSPEQGEAKRTRKPWYRNRKGRPNNH